MRLGDGSARKLSRKVSYSLERAPHYHEGFVKFEEMQMTGMVIVNDAIEEAFVEATGQGTPSWGVFKATVVSNVALQNCMLAIVSINPAFLSGESDDPHEYLILNEIPDLRAGHRTKVKFNSVPLTGRYFPLLFAGGREVLTDRLEPATEFFRRVELLKHAIRVRAYRTLNTATDKVVLPSIIFPPLLDDGSPLTAPSHPIIVRLSITEDGTVEAATLVDSSLSAPAQASILRTLHGWLFLPQLKVGTPVATEIETPLKF